VGSEIRTLTNLAPIHGRRALLAVAAGAALVAVLAGLARLGWAVPLGADRAMTHGLLFVLGVFCTVIGLERAVALGRTWAYAAPGLGAAAAVAQVAGMARAGALLALCSALALGLVNVAVVRRQAVAFTWLMLLGSALLAVGCGVWARGHPVFEAVPSWTAFFVLTIVAERLELSRLAPRPRWSTAVLVALGALIAATTIAAVAAGELWLRLSGGLIALSAVWLLKFDLARRTIRQPGLPRFAALGVLSGAIWLLLSGATQAIAGLPPSGPLYDAVLHGIFVGFVLSMVLAHAPIIVPAVARIRLPFHPAMYLALGVLHLGLVARIAGDFAASAELRRYGGLGNALALPLFAATAVLTRLWAEVRELLVSSH
jgi:hypothetical protein